MILNKKHLAFTLAEIMITLVITSIILAATYSIGKQKVDSYDSRYMYYATLMSLKEAFADMKASGCIAADLPAVCQNTKMLPSLGHTGDERGLCDRLAGYYNVPGGAGNCSATDFATPQTQILSSTTPNFTASNGARFYNLNSTSNVINSKEFYVDFDGPRGTTKWGTDLTCFNVDLISGGVAPCIDLAGNTPASSTAYLSLSVYYRDKATNSRIYVNENVPFCQAACTAFGGKIWGNNFSSYCSTAANCGGSYTQSASCTGGECEVEINKPSFIWGK